MLGAKIYGDTEKDYAKNAILAEKIHSVVFTIIQKILKTQ